MNSNKTYKQIFQLVWAFAIVWISLGSLVNFHQHHLWRKQLIPQVVASLNNKDKSRVVSQLKQNSGNSNANGIDLAVSDLTSDTYRYFAPASSLLQAEVNSEELSIGLNRSPGLRAPPAL